MHRRYGARVGGAPHIFFGPRPPRVFPRVFPIASARTPEAEHRMQVVRWLGDHGGAVRLAARHFGYAPATVTRWAQRFERGGVDALVDRSRRPKRTRTPTTPSAVVIRIRELRERYPRWGREKLRVLLEREGIAVSAKTIDRTLARLLERARQAFPFPIWAVQTDGGSECGAEFAATAQALGITHYVNRPNYPKGQGRVERSFRTDDLEFHEVEDLPMAVPALEERLAAWNHVYEEVRPHQALGYLTPNAFYARWLADRGGPAFLLAR